MSDRRPMLLFTTAAYAYLQPAFLAAGDFEVGTVERKHFPDGERYLRLDADSWGRDVVLLGGTPTDLDWMELYDLGCGIARAGARSLSIVMPYFGYSTMERAVRPGEIVTAKNRARLVSAIPRARPAPASSSSTSTPTASSSTSTTATSLTTSTATR